MSFIYIFNLNVQCWNSLTKYQTQRTTSRRSFKFRPESDYYRTKLLLSRCDANFSTGYPGPYKNMLLSFIETTRVVTVLLRAALCDVGKITSISRVSVRAPPRIRLIVSPHNWDKTWLQTPFDRIGYKTCGQGRHHSLQEQKPMHALGQCAWPQFFCTLSWSPRAPSSGCSGSRHAWNGSSYVFE